MTFSALAFAVAGHRLDERGDLHTADDRILLHVEDLLDGELARLEIIANLRTLDARGLRLLERFGARFGLS